MGDVIVSSRHPVLGVFTRRNVRSIRPSSGKTVKVPAVTRSAPRNANRARKARRRRAAARHAGDQGASASQALPLLMLTVAASLALRSNGGLLYDVLDPAVAGGNDEGSD